MTNMNPREDFVRFGIVTVCVAVPTYWLLVLISFRERLGLKKVFTDFLARRRGQKDDLMNGKRNHRSKDRKHLKLRPTQNSAVNASLERRLTSLSLSLSSSQGERPSIGRIDQQLDDVANKQNGAVAPESVPRRPTIRFNEPFDHTARHHGSLVAEPSPNTSDVDVAIQVRRPERVRSMEDGIDRGQRVPKRSSLLRRFSSGSGSEKEKGAMSPV